MTKFEVWYSYPGEEAVYTPCSTKEEALKRKAEVEEFGYKAEIKEITYNFYEFRPFEY